MDFKNAIKEMLDGKYVACDGFGTEDYNYRYTPYLCAYWDDKLGFQALIYTSKGSITNCAIDNINEDFEHYSSKDWYILSEDRLSSYIKEAVEGSSKYIARLEKEIKGIKVDLEFQESLVKEEQERIEGYKNLTIEGMEHLLGRVE